ncbi:MAG: BTAD domain-containing putative transcriptional regulator [Myxococcota bacterium]
MPVPFRHAPPKRASRDLIARPRLLEILDGRFERRVTFVQAGAGFGKTTLLAQAIEENLEEPVGLDVWLSCGPDDHLLAGFAAGLRGAVGAESQDGDPVQIVCDAIWRTSPRDVALFLDDVHHLEPGGDSAGVLAKLVAALPDNGHLVLASRRELPFPITRLLASGDACVIDESEMAFVEDERSAFFTLRAKEPAPGALPNWPAVLELATGGMARRIDDYLREEILAPLDVGRKRDLARLASLDWIDADRIHAFTGSSRSPAQLLADLPLTQYEGDAARLHALWRPCLAELEPAWSDDDFAMARRFLTERGDYREAVSLCLAHGREAELDAVLEPLTFDGWMDAPPYALDAIIEALPKTVRESPLGKLAQGLCRMHADPVAAEPFFEAARSEFHENGDERFELVAMEGLSNVAFWRADPETSFRLADMAEALDSPDAKLQARVVRASGYTLACQPDRANQEILAARSLPGELRGYDYAGLAINYLDSGHPQLALEEIDRGLPVANRMNVASMMASRFEARGLCGLLETPELEALDAGLPPAARRHAHNTAIFCSVLAFYNAIRGRRAAAEQHLDTAGALMERDLGMRAEAAYATAQMTLAVADGREAEAQSVIEANFAALPVASMVHRHTQRGAALAALVSPDARAQIADWSVGPCYQEGIRAALALVAHREDGDASAAAALDWSGSPAFTAFLVPSIVFELALVAAGEGNGGAERIAARLAPRARRQLRELAASPHAGLARAAEQLRKSVPARPDGQLELRVLGELEVVRDGIVSEDPALRRGRVRALLHHLALERTARREVLADRVWPDLDASAAQNNLRVNLNHLSRALEPERAAGEPAFFLRAQGADIQLVTGDGLELDVDLFERDLEEARKKDELGDPAGALLCLESALARYRGDFLIEGEEVPNAGGERTRLRSRFLQAALRAAALCLGRSDFRRSLHWTERALAVDPLCEEGHRTQAILYMRQGDRSAARASLARGVDALAAEGLSPDVDTRRMARRLGIRAGELG